MSTSQQESALFQILLNTLQELWIVKDRQMVLENVLQANGIDVHDAVDRFQPDEALQQRLDAERKQLLDRVLEPAKAIAGQ